MGGSSCVCFELKPSWNVGPESALHVLERAMAKWTITHQHIKEECQLEEGYLERPARRGTTRVRCQGYTTRLFDHIHTGLLGTGLTPPYDTGNEPYLNTPSGWLGWARRLAQLRHDTKRYLLSPNYDRIMFDFPVTTLGRPMKRKWLHGYAARKRPTMATESAPFLS